MSKVREDRLTLAAIKLQPRIGATAEERRLPQPCRADVVLFGDFEAAATTDSLERTVDYSRILARVLEVAHEKEYNLVETLAYRLAREILRAFPAHRVRVRLRKRPASLRENVDFVEVEVEDS